MGYIDEFLDNDYIFSELIIPNDTETFDSKYFSKYKNNKRIILPVGITRIEDGAFEDFDQLEEIIIPNSVNYIGKKAFKNCKNLRKVTLPESLSEINDECFCNCINLTDINLPNTISYIGNDAFKHCHSISSLTIPANLKEFGLGAFSYMEALENIYVSPFNKTFITPDHKILIDYMHQKLVLYVAGSKDKSYTLKDYVVKIDGLNREMISPISYIGPMAFVGSKNLEELTVCGCTDNIEYNAFEGCPNLKKLNIEGISFFTSVGFRIRDNGQYYFDDVEMPFEVVEYKGQIVDICTNALNGFSKVKKIILPTNGSYSISSLAFTDCPVSLVHIPNSVNRIKTNAFNDNTTLEFDNGLKINKLISLTKGRDYSKNQKLIDDIRSCNNGKELEEGFVRINPDGLLDDFYRSNKFFIDYDLYQINDNDFYIDSNGKISTISKTYIDKICTHPELIRDNPVLFFDFMNDLVNHDLFIKPLLNGILINGMNLKSRELLLESLDKNDSFFLEVLLNSGILDKKDEYTDFLLENFELVINRINLLKKHNVKAPEICHKLFMCCVDDDIFEELITLDYDLLCKVIIDSDICSITDKTENPWGLQIIDIINNKNLGENLLSYIKLIKGRKDKDRFLMNYLFICNNSDLCKKLIRNYDENIKRLIKASKILDGYSIKNIAQNFNDLLNLMEMTGALDDDNITRQKACTFITEKIFDEKLSNGKYNSFRIVGDDIHRIFNFGNTETKYKPEFATFFLENYYSLHQEEMNHSGIIERIYKQFDGISETSTSHKGSQRKLKVTMDKALSYLEDNKFDNVEKKYRDLAHLLGFWFDKNETWEKALMIYKESLQAPRNIFTKVEIIDGIARYDNNPDLDLKEEINDNYTFEWLPKQDYHNLVLGKYCNCCSHIEGAGQGIMRASMILDNCQNLVIRDDKGTIIGKSTLYVNKEEGYAVFNNVESSINNRSNEELKKIYQAFMRGITAFVDVYNENNPNHEINMVTIGSNRNTILSQLDNERHPEVPIKKSLSYGTYSINKWSSYNGDWSTKQRLVLKK